MMNRFTPPNNSNLLPLIRLFSAVNRGIQEFGIFKSEKIRKIFDYFLDCGFSLIAKKNTMRYSFRNRLRI